MIPSSATIHCIFMFTFDYTHNKITVIALQPEDEGEKFERLQSQLLLENPDSAAFYNAKMRTDRRVSLHHLPVSVYLLCWLPAVSWGRKEFWCAILTTDFTSFDQNQQNVVWNTNSYQIYCSNVTKLERNKRSHILRALTHSDVYQSTREIEKGIFY